MHEIDAAKLSKCGNCKRIWKRQEEYYFDLSGNYIKKFNGKFSVPDPFEVMGHLDWEPVDR